MNAQKNNKLDLIEQAMKSAFNASPSMGDYDMALWSAGVMADIRLESFDDMVDLKVFSRAAWFALAASLLFAAIVYITGDKSSDGASSLNDFYTTGQSVIETAYRN
jgi:hypothetical protein